MGDQVNGPSGVNGNGIVSGDAGDMLYKSLEEDQTISGHMAEATDIQGMAMKGFNEASDSVKVDDAGDMIKENGLETIANLKEYAGVDIVDAGMGNLDMNAMGGGSSATWGA